MSEAKILFIGPGAIGASVAAWVAEYYPAVFIMGHGETQAALRTDGITTYQSAAPEQTRRTVRVATVDRPGDIANVDIVVLAVKNYRSGSGCAAGSRRTGRPADHRVDGERHRQPAHSAEVLHAR